MEMNPDNISKDGSSPIIEEDNSKVILQSTIQPGKTKCKKCGKETSEGRFYHFYFGPDLGRHTTKTRMDNYIHWETIEGKKVDGIGDVYICNKCLKATLSFEWVISPILILLFLSMVESCFVFFTLELSLYNSSLSPNSVMIGFTIGILLLLLILVIIFWSRNKSRVHELEDTNDYEPTSDIKKQIYYFGDILAIRLGKKDVSNKKSSEGKIGYFYMTRRKYKLFLEGTYDTTIE
jgi:hypothetical protein